MVNRRHDGTGSSLYKRWCAIKQRCDNEKDRAYKNYGGRGIFLCPEWHDFAAFQCWAFMSGYQPHLLIDRIDNDGPYSPDNCRWVTRAISNVNKRQKYRPIIANGIEGSYEFWAKKLGVTNVRLRVRVSKGWSDHDVVNVPFLPRGKLKRKSVR